MWSGNFKTAVSSLRKSKWRSIFTMLGIIIGVSSVVTIVSLGEGLKHQLVGQISGLGSDVLTVRPGKVLSKQDGSQTINLLALFSASTLTAKDVSSLSQLPDVGAVVPVNFVTSSLSSEAAQADNVFVAGTSPRLAGLLHQEVNYGEFFQPEDEYQNVAVIGPAVAQRLFKDNNAVGSSITINGQRFIVHGVLNSTANSVISVLQADLNNSVFIPFQPSVDLASGRTNILQILVKSSGSASLEQTEKTVNKALLANHHTSDFTVLKQSELIDIASGLLSTATGFIGAIAGISLLVGGIGIMDIMLVSISERTREIGIRKAIGATNRQILSQFLTEGLALTIGGGIIGIIISLLINQFLRLYTSWKPIISVPVMILAVSVSITIGLVFSIAPALKAARKDPITALRGD